MSFVRTNWITGTSWCVGLLAAFAVVVRSHQPVVAIAPAVVAPLPDGSQVRSARCAACHAEIAATVETAPHWNALTIASSPEILSRFAGQTFIANEGDGDETSYEFSNREGQLWCRCSKVDHDLQIAWVFGSGRLAQTLVALRRDARDDLEMIEHRISWYPGVGLGLTLGQNIGSPSQGPSQTRIGIEYHGTSHGKSGAMHCFGCHASKLDPSRLDHASGVSAGLVCRRCHDGDRSHADREEGLAPRGPEMISWSQLTQRESVNRCGECHRRADQTPADEITTSAEHIVRFAPVGLVQSKCFLATEDDESMRLDCLTCHDPHLAASRDAALYAAKCRSCHDRPATPACVREPDSENCVSCHMRRRETQPHLVFTDHWIR